MFDPAVLVPELFRMRRSDLHEFDTLCQSLLDSAPALKWQHEPLVARRPPLPETMEQATNELLSVETDGLTTSWYSGQHWRSDRCFNEIWRLMDATCVAKQRLNGWTEGYDIAPDAYPRAWAKDVNTKRRSS
jgi:hypothetical protein